jgi:hypothetical protein
MGSATDELLGSGSYKPTSTAPQERYRGSAVDELLSISPRAGTETFKSLTDVEVIGDPRMSAGAGTAFMGGIPTDKQSAIKYFAQQRGIPTSRYRVIDGNIAYQADDGKFYKEIVTPLETAGYYAPDVLEAVPEVATGVATSVASPSVAIPATMAVAGGSNYLRQKIGEQLTGTPVDPLQVGISAGTAGIAEAVPFGVKALRERKTVRDIAGLDAQAMKELQSKARDFNISLTPAEITQLNSLMSQQKVLGNIPDSSKKMQKFYEFRENEQIQPAVEKFLSQVSDVTEQTQAGKLGIDALTARKAQLEEARELSTKPLYDASFAEAQPVDVTNLVKNIDEKLKTAKGEQTAFLTRTKSLLYKEPPVIDANGNVLRQGVLDDRLDALQNAKFQMDKMFKEEPFGSLDKKIQGQLKDIQNNLVRTMGVNNPKYLEANKVFAEASKPLEEFAERKTGTSLTQISPDNLNQFASRVFAGNDPNTIRYVKQQIEATNPDAWQAVTRAYMQDVWEKALTPSKAQKGVKLDSGAEWQNLLLGSRKQQDSLRAALGDDAFMALRDLSSVLKSAGSVKKLGSDTAFNQQILKEMQRDAELDPTGILARFVGTGISPQDWGRRINEWTTERAFAQNADKLANIITSPQGMQQLKELRKMSPTSAKTWAAWSQLLTNYGLIELKD